METKRCTKCGEEKPLSEFHKRSRSKDGLQGKCKSCAHVAKKTWYQENKEHERPRMKEYREKNKARISEKEKRYKSLDRDAKRIYELDMFPGGIEQFIGERYIGERYPGEACYLAKARKLMRGEVVDPHCEVEEDD